MSEFKRVKHPILGEYSARRPGDDVQVVDKPAADSYGRPLPAKPKTTVAKKAAASVKKAETKGDGDSAAAQDVAD